MEAPTRKIGNLNSFVGVTEDCLRGQEANLITAFGDLTDKILDIKSRLFSKFIKKSVKLNFCSFHCNFKGKRN